MVARALAPISITKWLNTAASLPVPEKVKNRGRTVQPSANGTAGDDVGNILTFGNEVFNSADTQQVGTDQGSCVRIVVGESWECSWTTFLPKGQITVQGPFSDTGDSVLAITGGTGAYRNVRGEMELKYHNPAGTKFDFVFHVIG